ncbi:MAG: transporter associated domain-containing protein, partial [Devosia sp.]
RTVLFVPPLMPVGDLLQQMQAKRVHMAVVIDEYGGTDGLVTIEDLLEAVVGEIEDEHDTEDGPLLRKINSNIFIASARAELGEVEALIGPDFSPGEAADDVETLGGLVFALAGHVPVRGEVIGGIKNFEFEVLQADATQLKRIKIKRLKQRKAASKPDDGTAAQIPAGKAAE